jgi:hypothetical protein
LRRPASCTSRNAASTIAALAGLTSTATRTALGISSSRRSSRLPVTLRLEKISYGLRCRPAGKAGDKTNLNRVIADGEHDRDCLTLYPRQIHFSLPAAMHSPESAVGHGLPLRQGWHTTGVSKKADDLLQRPKSQVGSVGPLADQLRRIKQRAYWAAFPTSTIRDTRIVKVGEGW